MNRANVRILMATIVLLLFGIELALSIRSLKFTNVKCTDHDIAFSHIAKCKLRVIRRGVVGLDIVVDLYKTPVTNSTINVALHKRANGYRPFLYNITQDVCEFFAHRKRFPVLEVTFSIFLKHSNLNHTCPYNDAIVVKDLVLEDSMFRLMPLPDGEYLFKVKVFAYNDLKATVQVFFNLKE